MAHEDNELIWSRDDHAPFVFHELGYLGHLAAERRVLTVG